MCSYMVVVVVVGVGEGVLATGRVTPNPQALSRTLALPIA